MVVSQKDPLNANLETEIVPTTQWSKEGVPMDQWNELENVEEDCWEEEMEISEEFLETLARNTRSKKLFLIDVGKERSIGRPSKDP